MIAFNVEAVKANAAKIPSKPPRPNRIRECRERARMSLDHLSKIIDLSRSEISKLENGARRLRMEHLTVLSEALGVKVTDLLNEDEAQKFRATIGLGASGNDNETNTATTTIPVVGVMTDAGFELDEENPTTRSQRPPQLAEIEGAYALHMPTTNLEPYVRVGTLLYVNPILPPRPEDLAIVRYTDSKRAEVVYISRDDSGQLIGKKFGNDEGFIDLTSTDVKSVHRVVGSWYS